MAALKVCRDGFTTCLYQSTLTLWRHTLSLIFCQERQGIEAKRVCLRQFCPASWSRTTLSARTATICGANASSVRAFTRSFGTLPSSAVLVTYPLRLFRFSICFGNRALPTYRSQDTFSTRKWLTRSFWSRDTRSL